MLILRKLPSIRRVRPFISAGRQFHTLESGLDSNTPDIQPYIDEQTAEAEFLEAEHRWFSSNHRDHPGSVSLCELQALTTRIGNLARESVEFYWDGKAFTEFFTAVMRRVPECDFLFTCGGDPQNPCATVWSRPRPTITVFQDETDPAA